MKNTQDFPLLVRIGLYGISSKKIALRYMYTCVLLASFSGVYGFIDSRFFKGLILLLSALWYWYCIKWVGSHAKWEKN